MPSPWLIERTSINATHISVGADSRLQTLERTHDIVSVTPDPHEKNHVVIVAKLRPVGYDA